MSSIGLFSFVTMQIEGGPFHEYKPGIKIIDRPNVDGILWRATARKSEPSVIRTVEGYTLLANATAAEAAYQALIGTYVTVVDPLGLTWTNIFIEDVVVSDVVKVGLCTVTSMDYAVHALWKIRRSS